MPGWLLTTEIWWSLANKKHLPHVDIYRLQFATACKTYPNCWLSVSRNALFQLTASPVLGTVFPNFDVDQKKAMNFMQAKIKNQRIKLDWLVFFYVFCWISQQQKKKPLVRLPKRRAPRSPYWQSPGLAGNLAMLGTKSLTHRRLPSGKQLHGKLENHHFFLWEIHLQTVDVQYPSSLKGISYWLHPFLIYDIVVPVLGERLPVIHHHSECSRTCSCSCFNK